MYLLLLGLVVANKFDLTFLEAKNVVIVVIGVAVAVFGVVVVVVVVLVVVDHIFSLLAHKSSSEALEGYH